MRVVRRKAADRKSGGPRYLLILVRGGEGFSVKDINRAVSTRMNSYVGMSYSGNVRRWVPGRTQYNGLNGVSGDLIYTVPK